jgi:hypothetical protein
VTESAPNPAVEAPAEPLGAWELTPAEHVAWGGPANGSSPPTAEAESAGADHEDTSAAAAAHISKLTSAHPELVILAAFAGGLLIATILKRLAR